MNQLHPVPTTPSHFLKIHLNIIYVGVSPVVSFPQVSPPEPCAHLSPPPYAPHAQLISFPLTGIMLLIQFRELQVYFFCKQCTTAGKGRSNFYTNKSEEIQKLNHKLLLFYSSYVFRRIWKVMIRQLRYTPRKNIQVQPVRITLIQLAKMSTFQNKTVVYGETG